jgi:hypothetical protein
MIKKLSVFPVLMKQDWLFRISVSDQSNIMVMVMNVREPNAFMMRYFTEESYAVDWINECAEGKHLDSL